MKRSAYLLPLGLLIIALIVFLVFCGRKDNDDEPESTRENGKSPSQTQTDVAISTLPFVPDDETTAEAATPSETTTPEHTLSPEFSMFYKLPQEGAKAKESGDYVGIYLYEDKDGLVDTTRWIRIFKDTKPHLEGSTNDAITFVGTKYKEYGIVYTATFRLISKDITGKGPRDYDDYPIFSEKPGWETVVHLEITDRHDYTFAAHQDSLGVWVNYYGTIIEQKKIGTTEELWQHAYYREYEGGDSDLAMELILTVEGPISESRDRILEQAGEDELIYAVLYKANWKYPLCEYPLGRYLLTDYMMQNRKEYGEKQ